MNDKFVQRKSLRKKLLLELYNHYFEDTGKPFIVKSEVVKDSEIKLAYEYLAGKKFISINHKGNYSILTITPYGIDAIEN